MKIARKRLESRAYYLVLYLAGKMIVNAQSHHPLRFVPLQISSSWLKKNQGFRSKEGEDSDGKTDDISKIHALVDDYLEKQEWLLEADQHIDLPKLDLEESKEAFFSLHDFVARADLAVQEDLNAVAFDHNGARRLLDEDQLEELRRTGQLSVPSALIKNQTHVWKVAPWFYSGIETIRKSFHDGLGAALDHLVVYTWSVSDSQQSRWLPCWTNTIRDGVMKPFRILGKAVAQVVSAPVFRPLYVEEMIEQILEACENSYVRYHLNKQGLDNRCIAPGKETYMNRCVKEEHVTELAAIMKLESASLISINEVNNRKADTIELEMAKFMKSASRRRQIELDYSDTIARQSPISARKEMRRSEDIWRKKIELEWIEHLFSFEDSIFHAEARRLSAKRVETKVMEADQETIRQRVDEFEEQLKQKRPILSLSSEWLRRSLDRFRFALEEETNASRMERIIEQLLTDGGFQSEAEERRLRRSFRCEHGNSLRTLLAAKRESSTHDFYLLQLNPTSWSVNSDDGRINRHTKVEVSLDRWFWRIRYIWYIFLSAALELGSSSYHFLVSGPLSIKALVTPVPYCVSKRPSTTDSDTMEDDPCSSTPTLTSRLRSFFGALRQDRHDFEAKPDVGLIGKSFQRLLLRLNHFFKATIGSTTIVLFMLLGSAFCTVLSGITLLASPVLALLWTLIWSSFNILFVDGPAESSGCLLKMIQCTFLVIVNGALQGILASVRHLAVHPMLGLGTLVWSSGRFFVRRARDFLTGCLMFKVVKTPADDTFLAKRISGPGFAAQSFLRLPVPAAKDCIELVLHQALVDAHVSFRRAELLESFRAYNEFVDSVLLPFGFKAQLTSDSPESISRRLILYVNKHFYRLMSNREREAFEDLHASIGAEDLTGIWDRIGSSVRLAHPDVQTAVDVAARNKTTKIHGRSITEYESKVRTLIQNGVRPMLSSVSNKYDETWIRPGQLLAELQLCRQFREVRMAQVVALPSKARERFRLAEAEMQELWKFTLNRTTYYASRIQKELNLLAAESQYQDRLRVEAVRISDSFWLHSEARPNKDVATVASHLLSTLLGGDLMLESLEEIDQTFVIEPAFSQADAHLIFWDNEVSYQA